MSGIAGIFEFMRQCPQLAQLWSIGGVEEADNSVILPQGASEAVQYNEFTDVTDGYNGEIIPFPSVYEDFQINCFKFYDTKDNSEPSVNINVMTYDEVRAVCDWVAEQDANLNFPDIGEKVISVECTPFVPQILYVNEQENKIAYFITLRVRYVNRRQKRAVEYEC